MYLEEKLIKGVLHQKTSPNGSWKAVPIAELSRRLVEAETKLQKEREANAVRGSTGA